MPYEEIGSAESFKVSGVDIGFTAQVVFETDGVAALFGEGSGGHIRFGCQNCDWKKKWVGPVTNIIVGGSLGVHEDHGLMEELRFHYEHCSKTADV